MLIDDEELFPAVFHSMLAEVVHEKGNVCWLSILIRCRYGQLMPALVGKEHLESASAGQLAAGLHGRKPLVSLS